MLHALCTCLIRDKQGCQVHTTPLSSPRQSGRVDEAPRRTSRAFQGKRLRPFLRYQAAAALLESGISLARKSSLVALEAEAQRCSATWRKQRAQHSTALKIVRLSSQSVRQLVRRTLTVRCPSFKYAPRSRQDHAARSRRGITPRDHAKVTPRLRRQVTPRSRGLAGCQRAPCSHIARARPSSLAHTPLRGGVCPMAIRHRRHRCRHRRRHCRRHRHCRSH